MNKIISFTILFFILFLSNLPVLASLEEVIPERPKFLSHQEASLEIKSLSLEEQQGDKGRYYQPNQIISPEETSKIRWILENPEHAEEWLVYHRGKDKARVKLSVGEVPRIFFDDIDNTGQLILWSVPLINPREVLPPEYTVCLQFIFNEEKYPLFAVKFYDTEKI